MEKFLNRNIVIVIVNSVDKMTNSFIPRYLIKLNIRIAADPKLKRKILILVRIDGYPYKRIARIPVRDNNTIKIRGGRHKQLTAPLCGIIQCLLHPAIPCQVSSPGCPDSVSPGNRYAAHQARCLRRDFGPVGENNSKNSDSSMRGRLRWAAAASSSAAI